MESNIDKPAAMRRSARLAAKPRVNYEGVQQGEEEQADLCLPSRPTIPADLAAALEEAERKQMEVFRKHRSLFIQHKESCGAIRNSPDSETMAKHLALKAQIQVALRESKEAGEPVRALRLQILRLK